MGKHQKPAPGDGERASNRDLPRAQSLVSLREERTGAPCCAEEGPLAPAALDRHGAARRSFNARARLIASRRGGARSNPRPSPDPGPREFTPAKPTHMPDFKKSRKF